MQHWYTKEGKATVPYQGFPSVTTILGILDKPELDAWRAKVGPEYALKRQQESSNRGKTIHKLVENTIEGREAKPDNEDQKEMLDGYSAWIKKYQPTNLESEVFVYSETHKYAGTLDIRCRLNGELWIIDTKTSRRIEPEYGLQLAAYEQASYELIGEHAKTAILHLTPETQSHYRFKPTNDPLNVFLALRQVFAWQAISKEPRKHIESVFDGRYIMKKALDKALAQA
jgi:hypothetical protein